MTCDPFMDRCRFCGAGQLQPHDECPPGECDPLPASWAYACRIGARIRAGIRRLLAAPN